MRRIGFSGSCGPPHRVNQGNSFAPSGTRTASNLRRAAGGFEATPVSGALMRRGAALRSVRSSPACLGCRIRSQRSPGHSQSGPLAVRATCSPDHSQSGPLAVRATCSPDHSGRAISIRRAVTPHRLHEPRARSRTRHPPSCRWSSRSRRDSGWRRRTDRPRAGPPAPRDARSAHRPHPAQARGPR